MEHRECAKKTWPWGLGVDYLQLIDGGVPVRPPRGLVYSTSPRSALGEDGDEYIVKGPDPQDVVAEALGYLLAGRVGLRVPDFRFARVGDGPTLFASRKVPSVLRDVVPFIVPGFDDGGFLPLMAAFDMWVANTDRNPGNLIAQEVDGHLRLFAIDFGRAMALRGPTPLISTSDIASRKCLPHTRQIEAYVRQNRGVRRSASRIMAITEDEIRSAIGTVERSVGIFSWGTSTAQTLLHRQKKLIPMLMEAWL